MSTAIDSLIDQASQITDVVESAIVVLDGIKKQLDDAIAAGNLSAVQTVADNLGTERLKLAAAIARDTPADPSAPPVTTPAPVPTPST